MNRNIKTENTRLSKIDFLRALAVILVLGHHHWWVRAFFTTGWSGVDLFFVLSGFLVSGLLFAEYKKFGDIRPLHFLIRRGFKIYPLFYTSIAISFLIFIFEPQPGLNYKGYITEFFIRFTPEIFFLQNYLDGVWMHHWSLAVEEHFYILLSILVFLLVRRSVLTNRKLFFSIAFGIFAGCLLLRIFSNLLYPTRVNFFETHLRIDSLFAGVLISFIYHFHNDELARFYQKYKKGLLVLIFIPLLLMPFPINSFFIKTVGFTLLYISYGALLILFLFSQKITDNLKRIFTPFLYSILCTVGFYSYGIYLFHMYFAKYVVIYHPPPGGVEEPEKFILNGISTFLGYFLTSILMGMAASKLVEIPFLRMRERYFPKRTS